jgi:hypothetical protein
MAKKEKKIMACQVQKIKRINHLFVLSPGDCLFFCPAALPAPTHNTYPAGAGTADNSCIGVPLYLLGISSSWVVNNNGAVVAAGSIRLPLDVVRTTEPYE